MVFNVDQELLDLLNLMAKGQVLLDRRVTNLEETLERKKNMIEALYADISRLRGEVDTLQKAVMNIPGEGNDQTGRRLQE